MEDLPDMIDLRYGHGCGHFTNTDGVLVDCKYFIFSHGSDLTTTNACPLVRPLVTKL